MQSRDRAQDSHDAVAAQLPGYRINTVTPLGEGQDNLAYEVNGELIVRFSKEADPVRRATLVDREARLLTTVAGFSPVPVPEPRFTIAEQGCLAYFKLPGRPLLDLPPAERLTYGPSVAATLGDLLSALHAVPVDRLAGLVEVDAPPLSEWLDEAAEIHPTIIKEIPEARRRAVQTFLDTPPPDGDYDPVFSHNDLGIEHVLIAPATGAVTGVIDWSDAAIVDPAYDFGLLYRDLGPTALEAALGGYRPGDVTALRERAVFYGRCGLFEDLAYGLETGQDAYVGKSRTAMEWLFHS
ncbi:phosphotransferase family protein [Streptosporangium amethystogenes]|uniref:phosphotransferase family protein n=1 Tax=Streptosporangium amethystogenes TaxID=2002 RepID=UPI00068EF7FA|nr:phosphotransferase [Streptosporangium amethystogenes]